MYAKQRKIVEKKAKSIMYPKNERAKKIIIITTAVW